MLNIHSIKTVSSLVVYLTFDDFRYDCNDDMFKWRWIRLLIILTLSFFFAFSMYYCTFLYVFNSCHSCHYSCHSVRYMSCWNKRLLTLLSIIGNNTDVLLKRFFEAARRGWGSKAEDEARQRYRTQYFSWTLNSVYEIRIIATTDMRSP